VLRSAPAVKLRSGLTTVHVGVEGDHAKKIDGPCAMRVAMPDYIYRRPPPERDARRMVAFMVITHPRSARVHVFQSRPPEYAYAPITCGLPLVEKKKVLADLKILFLHFGS